MFLNKHVNYSSFFIQNRIDPNKYLISSVLINKVEYERYIQPQKYKNILFITEPIKHFNKEGDRYEYPYKGIIENKFDIIIDGVSLLKNYRTDFQEHIQNNGINSLIAELNGDE